MKITTALNHLQRFQDRMDSLYFSAKTSKMSHADLLSEFKAFWQDIKLAKLPGWAIARLMARRDILSRQHYDVLVWAFPATNGQIKPYDKLSDSDRKLVHDGHIQGGHYYFHDIVRKNWSADGTRLIVSTERIITPCKF